MEYKEIQPPPVLSGFVRHFWSIDYAGNSSADIPFRLMADGFPNLLFQYKNRFKDGILHHYSFPASLLLGPTNYCRDLLIDGAFSVFGVALFPHVPSLIYRLAGPSIAVNVIDGKDLFKNADSCLDEQVAMAGSNDERIQILSRYLVKKLSASTPDTDVIVHDAVKYITDTKGSLAVESLVANMAISRRQFERRFMQHIGISPKLLSRIIRFQNSLRCSLTLDTRNLTSLAFACGYADQAHFIREFKEFSGINPKYYFTHQEKAAENLLEYKRPC